MYLLPLSERRFLVKGEDVDCIFVWGGGGEDVDYFFVWGGGG